MIKIGTFVPILHPLLCYSDGMNTEYHSLTNHLFTDPQPLAPDHYPAATSRPVASQLSTLSGGGILPRSRRQCRHWVAPTGLPTVEFVVHVANPRCAPVFPPVVSAEISPQHG
jgi:hypothetical protein